MPGGQIRYSASRRKLMTQYLFEFSFVRSNNFYLSVRPLKGFFEIIQDPSRALNLASYITYENSEIHGHRAAYPATLLLRSKGTVKNNWRND